MTRSAACSSRRTSGTLSAVGGAASLVECRLATGRTHQIRVHMATMGHPVIGDASYGGGATPARRNTIGDKAADAVKSLGRQALHARLIGFRHPASGEEMTFERDFPRELNELYDILMVS